MFNRRVPGWVKAFYPRAEGKGGRAHQPLQALINQTLRQSVENPTPPKLEARIRRLEKMMVRFT